MSIKVMSLVWEKSAAKGKELLLMLAIADFADDYGYAYPGLNRLSKKCRVSRRTVQRAEEKCIERGELDISRNAGIETKHGKTNLYKINIKQLLEGGVNMTPVTHVSRQGVTHVSPKPSVEPSVIHAGKNGNPLIADPVADILKFANQGVSEITAPNPVDQYWINRDAFLKEAQRLGRPNEFEKEAIIKLVEDATTPLTLWQKSITETGLHYKGGDKIARAIEVCRFGQGDYEKWRQWKYPTDNGKSGNKPQHPDEPIIDPATGQPIPGLRRTPRE